MRRSKNELLRILYSAVHRDGRKALALFFKKKEAEQQARGL